jgi:Domain of unknown function (DUF5666)
MDPSKTRTSGFLLAVLLLAAGSAFGASPAGQWSGTVASVAGDDLVLVGVPDHFRLAGGVTELLSGRSLTSQDVAPGSAVTFRVGDREADGRVRADQAAVLPKNPLTLTGTVDRVGDDRRHVTVHGVEIEIDDQTSFSGRGPSGALRSARDLRAGASVSVTLASTASGALRATGISPASGSTEPGEDQELKGTVTAVSDTAWTIDSKVFAITDQTVFRGDPGVGDFVEVRFHLDTDGNRVADRIHKDDAAPGAQVEFMGIVEAISDTAWTISGRVVNVDGTTEIVGNPVVGDNVEVEAVKGPDDALTARRIRREDAREQEVEFQGAVQAIGATSWTIAGQVVTVNAATRIDGSPAVGDNVEVKANKAADGSLTATRIQAEDNQGHDGGDQGDDHGNDGNSGNSQANNSGSNDANDDNGTSVHGGNHGGANDPTGQN